ncbi:MAG: hypothetical protein ACFFDK_11220 [Promethearchaeota archaeon]
MLFITPFMSNVQAQNAGSQRFNEGDVFVWKAEYSDSTSDDIYHDYLRVGRFNWVFSDPNVTWVEYSGYAIPKFNLDDKVEAIDIEITKIEEGRAWYIMHESKSRADNIWKKKSSGTLNLIYSWDFYKEFKEDWIEVDYEYFDGFIYSYRSVKIYPKGIPAVYIIPEEIDFKELTNDLDNYFHREEYDYDDIKVTYDNFENTLHISLGYDREDLGDMDYIFKYSEDGILSYYEFKYAGDTVVKLEREWEFLNDYYNLLIIGVLGLISLAMVFYFNLIKSP